MFTGLVETTGVLRERAARGPGFRIAIAAALGRLELGESIAVNGVCLTVTEVLSEGFFADVSAETVARTSLGRVPIGAELNLERSLRAGDRLGGHWVVGHVDVSARVDSVAAVGEARRVLVRPPAELSRYIAAKGSVTLDGVSLTVNAVHGVAFEIMLIPHTLAVTNLKELAAGSELNLEVDLLARYVVHFLESTGQKPDRDAGLLAALERAGYAP